MAKHVGDDVEPGACPTKSSRRGVAEVVKAEVGDARAVARAEEDRTDAVDGLPFRVAKTCSPGDAAIASLRTATASSFR